MPLTAKGNEILSAMRKHYGKKRGTSVFYASINGGRVTGAEKGKSSQRYKPRKKKRTSRKRTRR